MAADDEKKGAAYGLARVTIDVMVVGGFADGEFDRAAMIEYLEEELANHIDLATVYDATVTELKSPSDLVLEAGWDNDTPIFGDVDAKIGDVREVLKAREREARHAALQQPLPLGGGDEDG